MKLLHLCAELLATADIEVGCHSKKGQLPMGQYGSVAHTCLGFCHAVGTEHAQSLLLFALCWCLGQELPMLCHPKEVQEHFLPALCWR